MIESVVYFGAYLKVPKKDGLVETSNSICENKHCRSFGCEIHTKFCGDCGERIFTRHDKKLSKVSSLNLKSDEYNEWRDVFETTDKYVWYLKGNFEYFVPKKTNSHSHNFDLSIHSCGNIEISNDEPEKAKKDFILKYQKYIDRVISEGVTPEICYGIFIYEL